MVDAGSALEVGAGAASTQRSTRSNEASTRSACGCRCAIPVTPEWRRADRRSPTVDGRADGIASGDPSQPAAELWRLHRPTCRMMVPVVRRLMLVSLLVGLVACSSPGSVQPASMRRGTVVFEGGDRLRVRIAETQAERAAGLMHVMALAADDGMAFVFDGPVTDRFWMKDTLIPLSVAFVAGDDRIISVSDMDPCTADPCPTYPASGPYTMAVEANLGWFHDHGVDVGSDAQLEPADG
jgi:uncharacterized membrane protein (UPF0127 family)